MKKILILLICNILASVVAVAQEAFVPVRIQETEAVSMIDSSVISKFNSDILYTSMYGTLPGLFLVENPGAYDDVAPNLFIRGGATFGNQSPLILVDGFVRDISDISAEEIESISVLKDAAATALYGMQGANGIISVKTKRGTNDSMKGNVNYKFGFDIPYAQPRFADAYTYAEAVNEALRLDGRPERYAPAELEAFQSGMFPDIYPDVDWLKEGLRDLATKHQVGFTFEGGGKHLKYFTHIDYQNYMGLLRHTRENPKYSTQLRKNKLSARVNLDAQLTRTTQLRINLHGLINEKQSPSSGEEAVFQSLYNTPSHSFPVRTIDGYWGGSDYLEYNPIARIADSGYSNLNGRRLHADIRLKQDFVFLLPGLFAELAFAWDNASVYKENQFKNYQYQVVMPYVNPDSSDIAVRTQDVRGEQGTLKYNSTLYSQQMMTAFEAKIGYGQTFSRHRVDLNLLYRLQSTVPMGRNTIRKFQNVALYGGYNYDRRYFIDFTANYDGASVLLKGAKYDFFPSLSVAWMISNEAFLKNAEALNLLKIRYSWGRSGHTGFGYELDRYFYVPGDDYFYTSGNKPVTGMKESDLPVNLLQNQRSSTMNFGLDLGLFHGLNLSADIFAEDRSRILLDTESMHSGALGVKPAPECSGRIQAYGVEASLSWNRTSGDFKYGIGTNFSFARNRVIENNEGQVHDPYLSAKGHPVGQFFGLQADGFFNSEEDIAKAPVHTFSKVKPGDIRYIDQNNDGRIDANDMKPFGYSTLRPEIFYGISLNFKWKGLGCDLHFQGAANYNKLLDAPGLYRPLAEYANLSSWVMADNVRWTPQTIGTATLPRLSVDTNKNNAQPSTLYLVDASYFSLKNMYVYYDFPSKWFSRCSGMGLQIYFRGENVFSVDNLKYSHHDNPNVLYPLTRNFYCGINFKF